VIGQATRISALRDVIDHAPGNGQACFCKRVEIARWWQTNHQDRGRDAKRLARIKRDAGSLTRDIPRVL
jgi:hypothetical protein